MKNNVIKNNVINKQNKGINNLSHINIANNINNTVRINSNSKSKSKIKVKFEQMSKFCSCDGNYKNIRNDMNLCEKNGESFIPYLGMLLKDINFFEESGKYLNEKGCINMDKIEKINDLFDKYFKYKKV